MDDSTQSLLEPKTPASFNTFLTLFAKACNPPWGNENHSLPPLQVGWILKPSAVKFWRTLLSAALSASVTGNIWLHTNRWGFPVWSSPTRAPQLLSGLADEPTFPNGGADWLRQANILMIYTTPVVFFGFGFGFGGTVLVLGPAGFVVTVRWGRVFWGFDDDVVLWGRLPDTFASSAGSNHSEESAPVLL